MQLSPNCSEALVYAAEMHAQQQRKSTDIPYVTHILAVTSIALDYGADENEAIAALLHDGPEDAGGSDRLKDIRHRFGAIVGDIVAGCSETFEAPKPPWRQRKEASIAHLQQASQSVRLIAAADKLNRSRQRADLRLCQ